MYGLSLLDRPCQYFITNWTGVEWSDLDQTRLRIIFNFAVMITLYTVLSSDSDDKDKL